MLKLIFLLLALSAPIQAKLNPISCTAVHFQAWLNDSDQYDLASVGDFKLSAKNGTTYVSVSNVTVLNRKNNESATAICYYKNCCALPLTSSCTFPIGDTFVLLYANFSTDSTPVFPGLIADDGTFSTSKLFSLNRTCLSSSLSENGTVSNHTICCTASIPAPVAPKVAPKCKRFSSRTTIYNTDYSIYGTSKISYDVVGRTLVPSSLNVSLPNNYFVCYFDHTFFNMPLVCDQLNVVLYNNVTMDSGDTKFLISTFFLPYGTIFGINGILSARLLYRGNNLLMKEGVPFTTKNNCLYLSAIWAPNPSHPTSAEFCCTAFESS